MLKKVLIILLIGISMTGCSSLQRKVERQEKEDKRIEMEEKIAETNRKKMIEDGYQRIEGYKTEKDYTEYEIREDYSDKSKILKIIRGKNCYKIGENYQTKGIPTITIQEIFLYGCGSMKLFIYENKGKKWEIDYKVGGIKSMIDSNQYIVNNFELKVKDKNTGAEIKSDISTLKPSGLEYALTGIYYNNEKISFEQIGFLVDTTVKMKKFFPTRVEKVAVTEQLYKKMIGYTSEYIIELKIVKNNEDIGKIVLKNRKSSVLYIKNGVDEDLKSFLFKTALLLKLHKEIRNDLQQKKFN